jgi:hypothetical protein
MVLKPPATKACPVEAKKSSPDATLLVRYLIGGMQIVPRRLSRA